MHTLRDRLRAIVLAARAGDGSTLLRDDMPFCQPEASAGIIADALIHEMARSLGSSAIPYRPNEEVAPSHNAGEGKS